MIINLPIKRVLSDSRVTNISKSFTHKMAVKTSWRRYGTKVRHCHPKYSRVAILSAEISRCQKRLRDVRVVEEHAEGCDGPASIEPLFVAANSCCPAVMVFFLDRFIRSMRPAIPALRDKRTDRQTDSRSETAYSALSARAYPTLYIPRTYRKLRKSAEKCNSETVRRVMTAD